MRKIIFLSYIAISVFLLLSCNNKAKKIAESKDNIKKPNIIYILADDLGYGELGCYGQKYIETPNIDKLSQQGMTFLQHYSGAPVCAPARCTLLTGKHLGHADVRGNDAWNSRGNVWNYKAMIADSTLEGQRPLPESTITLGNLLQKAGYKTAIIGKWGLGAPHTQSTPNDKGFDYFYGYNCQRMAHTYYPVHLYENKKRVHLKNDTVAPNTRLPKGANPYDSTSYKKFSLKEFSPDLMFGKAISFIEKNRKQPFFLYWATPIPHVPLQSSKKWIDYYHNKFGEEKPYEGKKGYFPNRYPHATYAAMISYLDENIGILINKLKELGIYDNTLIIFSSDNGPTYNGGTDSHWFRSAAPFKSEQGWVKGSLREGGIRVPMIASFPGVIKEGSKTDLISYFPDVLPTLCELAGVIPPKNIDGISFLPELKGQKQNKHPYLYWEFAAGGGSIAVRLGNYKALLQKINRNPNAEFKLYNLKEDPQEQNNIASEHPEIISKVKEIVEKEHTTSTNKHWRLKPYDNNFIEKSLVSESL